MTAADRARIENKYHIQGQPFDPFKRMAYHGYDFDPATGWSDEEIRAGLDAMTEELDALPRPIAKARAVKFVLDHTRIDAGGHDFFVGLYSVNRLANRVTLDRRRREVFGDLIPDTKAAMDEMCASGADTVWPDFDHVVPDWNAILTLGFPGLRARAASYHAAHRAAGTLTDEADAHFCGIDILFGAILDLIDRLYRLAAAQNHDKAAVMAHCLRHIHDGAPTDTYEAMQVMYLYFMISECFESYQVRALGSGLDASLRPFWHRDLADGVHTCEELCKLLSYFLLQWSAIGNYWGQPFYLGGTKADGSSAYDDVSRDILRVYDDLRIYNPKIQLKVAPNTPDDILRHAFSMIRAGHGSFVFCCEPGMTRAVMAYGATAEEARTMDIRGCYETGVRGGEVCTGTNYVNAPKALQYVLTRGYEPLLRKQFGLDTGDLASLTTFDAFYRAVLRQWEHLIEMMIARVNEFEPYLSYINPSLMYSATIEHSLRLGGDAYQCGAKFNNTALLNCGMATLIDGVMAVRELVYEAGVVTLPTLAAALEADWVGYDELRLCARRSRHKYGNGDALTDRYAAEMAAFFADHVNGRPNARGGVFKANMHSAMQFVWQGKLTPATPDGRCAGEEVSKNASPSVGMDREGVTALIRSALSMRPHTYHESFCLDVMLHPSAVSGEEGLIAMKGLLMAYLAGDGMSIQFNVFSPETLRDAQAHPDRYRNLQVRVCGWNVLWNDLPPTQQEAYIRRAASLG